MLMKFPELKSVNNIEKWITITNQDEKRAVKRLNEKLKLV